MSKINSQLPNKFIVDIILAGSRLISDLALMHGIEPTPQNIYEAGKMLSSVGLTMSAASRHLSPEEMKNDMKKEDKKEDKPIQLVVKDVVEEDVLPQQYIYDLYDLLSNGQPMLAN